ncbi:hypothetical protein OD551_000005 [Salmonella enterica]|nr:hypothetical protein [Salmonella enterica subsp. enterica serovar Muenchen]EJX4467532.1 hypothetical protein [Salmonella enterica]EJX4490303.1 hypothetical protein [Salmonella enterica]EJX4505692.1 hypothetical protein [Salmonella enterica]
MEQVKRSKRYLNRIEKIYSGIFSSSGHNKEDYDDDVISFFIHCYHIRDWIIHLNTLNIRASHVDIFINEHQALKICADLANYTYTSHEIHQSLFCSLDRKNQIYYQPQEGADRRQNISTY